MTAMNPETYIIIWTAYMVGSAMGVAFAALARPRGWEWVIYPAAFIAMAVAVRPLVMSLVVPS
jgi:hypothetical protein